MVIHMILNKRLLRDLKKNFLRYFAIFIVIVISMYVVVGMAGAAQTVINGVEQHAKDNAVEDGQFTVFQPLSDADKSEISDMGVEIEEHFYLDFDYQDSTLRLYTNRESIDKFEKDTGVNVSEDNQILLEKHYCEANDVEVGDTIQIGGMDLEVVGIGSTPDYDDVLQNMTDASADAEVFGTAFVSVATYDELLKSGLAKGTETYEYAYQCDGEELEDDFRQLLSDFTFQIDAIEDKIAYDYFHQAEEKKDDFTDAISEMIDSSDELKKASDSLTEAVEPLGVMAGSVTEASGDLSEAAEKLKDGAEELDASYQTFSEEYLNFSYSNLKTFTSADVNPRINASADDIVVNKSGALVAGVIITILIAYILSVFVTNSIEQECKVIGTLYSLGYEKRELLFHFLIIPSLVALIGGAVGTVLGMLSIPSQIEESTMYFSYPELATEYPAYLIIYGAVVPFVMSIVVNLLVINKKLSNTPLSMLRKQHSLEHGKEFSLKNVKFITQFRFKLFFREIRSNITIALGIFLSLLLVMLAMCIFSALTTIVDETERDVKFNYLYYLSFPEEEVSYDAESAYMEQLNKEIYGYDMSVSILGIHKDSEYFPYDIETKKNELYVSTSVAEKYGLKEGDDYQLTDEVADISYNFKVTKVVDYAPGLFVFMELDSMRELFDKDEDYYNVLLSEDELDIDTGRIYSVNTSDNIITASKIFMKLMKKLIYVLIFASVLIFVVVMYLMVKMVIERQANNISMFKMFGYNGSEISSLYLRNNVYTVIVSTLVFIPITRWIILKIYPYLVANRSVGFNLSFTWDKYAFIVGLVLVSYVIAYVLAKFRLRKISLVEVLKDVE